MRTSHNGYYSSKESSSNKIPHRNILSSTFLENNKQYLNGKAEDKQTMTARKKDFSSTFKRTRSATSSHTLSISHPQKIATSDNKGQVPSLLIDTSFFQQKLVADAETYGSDQPKNNPFAKLELAGVLDNTTEKTQPSYNLHKSDGRFQNIRQIHAPVVSSMETKAQHFVRTNKYNESPRKIKYSKRKHKPIKRLSFLRKETVKKQKGLDVEANLTSNLPRNSIRDPNAESNWLQQIANISENIRNEELYPNGYLDHLIYDYNYAIGSESQYGYNQGQWMHSHDLSFSNDHPQIASRTKIASTFYPKLRKNNITIKRNRTKQRQIFKGKVLAYQNVSQKIERKRQNFDTYLSIKGASFKRRDIQVPDITNAMRQSHDQNIKNSSINKNSKTNADVLPNQMMQMRFLQPGQIGSSRYIDPLVPNQPTIKLFTMGSNSLPKGQGIILQPGSAIPGSPSFKIPSGFRGRLYLGDRNFYTGMSTKQVIHAQQNATSTKQECDYYRKSCSNINYHPSLCSPIYIQLLICCC